MLQVIILVWIDEDSTLKIVMTIAVLCATLPILDIFQAK